MAVQNKIINKKYNTLNFQRADEQNEPALYQRMAAAVGALLFFLTGGFILLMVGVNSFDPALLLISIVLFGALVYIILSVFMGDNWE